MSTGVNGLDIPSTSVGWSCEMHYRQCDCIKDELKTFTDITIRPPCDEEIQEMLYKKTESNLINQRIMMTVMTNLHRQ